MGPPSASSAPPYRWQGLQFAVPAGWTDDSLITLTAPGAGMNLTVTRDRLSGSLDAYAKAQEAAVAAQRVPGYKAQPMSTERHGAVDVVVCERQLSDGKGNALVQLQAFAAVGGKGTGTGTGTEIVLVTATGAKATRSALHDALRSVLASLSVEST